MKDLSYSIAVALVAALSSCSPVVPYQEDINVAVLGYVEEFQVPDSCARNYIPVRLKGVIGESAAFSFDRINYAQTDSLFRIGVWGRQIQKTGVEYATIHVGFDTVLVLQTTKVGQYFIDVVAGNGLFRDTTYVHQ